MFPTNQAWNCARAAGDSTGPSAIRYRLALIARLGLVQCGLNAVEPRGLIADPA